jgi:DNA-binding transcriptional ArsR family regulator
VEDLSAALSALSDPSRRVLLQRLAHGPATSGQLAELLSISRPATSQHLQVLQAAGLVTTEPLGRQRWQQLAPAPLYLVEGWTHQLVETWASAPTLRIDRSQALRQESRP